MGHPSAKDILSRNGYRFVIVFVIVQRGKHFWKMAWTKECWKGGLLSSSMLAWKRENTKRSSGRLEQWRDKKSIQIQLVTTYCSNTCLNTKLFAILRNKENWPGSRVSAYFCTSSVVWAGHPSMLSHMNWFPCYRFGCFWDFTISFLHIKMHIFTW